jgi:hypothetical protein
MPRTEHDRYHMSHGRRTVHALERFKERYGRELAFDEYWKMVLALRNGCGEFLWQNHIGRLYQLEWNGDVVYPICSYQSQRKGILITTFFTPMMALQKLTWPYFSVGRDRNRLLAKIARKKSRKRGLAA